MVQKPDIQYVTQFYTYGSEARVLELKSAKKKKKTALPKALPQQKIRILVDPVACAGIVIAILLVALMAFSVRSYLNACAEYEAMTAYVISLQNTNVTRGQEYAAMYDPEDVREKAIALGMIPMEKAEVVTITPVIPEPEPEEPWWENISWFLKGLFA